jgi:hypothetical protein
MHTEFLSEDLKKRDHSQHRGIDGRITLEWLLEKLIREVGTGFIWLRIRTSAGLL